MNNITVSTYDESGALEFVTECNSKEQAINAVRESIRNGHYASVIRKDGKIIDDWTQSAQRTINNAFGGYFEYDGLFAEI